MEDIFLKICQITLYFIGAIAILVFWGMVIYACVNGLSYLYNLLL